MTQDAKRIKVGDIVVLKSGGPRMTVDDYIHHIGTESPDEIDVTWFNGKQLCSGRVCVEAVKRSRGGGVMSEEKRERA